MLIRSSLALAVWLATGVAQAEDWTHWRGPQQNGAVNRNAAVTSWSLSGDNLLWQSPVGGRSVPMVHEGHVFLIGPVGEGATLGERVVCLDAADGRLLWEQRFPVFLTDIVENRVGWTALAVDPETGNVFAHGTGGELHCFSRDGRAFWKRSLVEEFGRFSGYGGRLYSPIIDEDRVVISFLSTGWSDKAPMVHLYVALDKRDGHTVWAVTPGERPLDTTYATPVVAILGGQRRLICPSSDGWVYALQSRTGQTDWKYRLAARPLNISPVVDGDHVYVGHSEENFDTTVMGRLACILGVGSGDITKTNEIWRHDGIDAGYASPTINHGRLYLIDNSAGLHCFDAKTGQSIWDFSLGRIGRGSPVITADGVIYAGEQNGAFWILRDAGDKPEVLSKVEFPKVDDAITEMQGSPSIADGRVYFQTRYGTYCLASKTAAPAPAGAAVAAAAETDPPGELITRTLISPAEVTLAPGESVRFELSAFTSAGKRAVRFHSQEPRWSVAGVKGTLDETSQTFTADPTAAFGAGVVKVKWVGDEESVARVRIAPDRADFQEDFESYPADSVPAGWQNVAQRVKVVERDGNRVLQTLSEKPSPIFMRLRMYMTPPLEGGYTLQADMLGSELPRWMPDMGLINTRYELRMLGNMQTLRLVTWDPIPRLQKDLPFEWQADVWYRVKLSVKPQGDKALVRGKVWPREQPEPAAWTIEMEDPFPNREGSPALYSYAAGTTEKKKGTVVCFDNIRVMAHEE